MTTVDERTGTARTWTTVAAACGLAGGTAWLLKQAAIALAATGDEPPESGFIAAFYLAGLALMLVGASGIAALLLRRSAPVVWIPVAVLSAPVVFFGVQAAVDAVVDALAGPGAHWWWESEGGIVLTALVFLGIGAVLLAGRRRTARQRSVAAGV
jgi:hypothetical protein